MAPSNHERRGQPLRSAHTPVGNDVVPEDRVTACPTLLSKAALRNLIRHRPAGRGGEPAAPTRSPKVGTTHVKRSLMFLYARAVPIRTIVRKDGCKRRCGNTGLVDAQLGRRGVRSTLPRRVSSTRSERKSTVQTNADQCSQRDNDAEDEKLRRQARPTQALATVLWWTRGVAATVVSRQPFNQSTGELSGLRQSAGGTGDPHDQPRQLFGRLASCQ